jgi:hypothetical protein
VRPSGNEMSYKCETIEGRVSAIRNRFEDFGQKKKENIWKAKSGEKKIMVRKVWRKIGETL